MIDLRNYALAMVLLRHVETRVDPVVNALRAEGKTDLIPGESVYAVSPLDGKTVLGKITRTKPEPKARVDDEAALMAWMSEEIPGGLADEDVVAGTPEQVVAALKEHAPHLVKQVVVMQPWAVNQVLRQSEAANNAVAPGVKVDTPIGTVIAYPSADAVAHLEQVIRSGSVAIDSRVRAALGPASSDG